MNHIINFAVDFDDKKITEAVEKTAEREIIKDLKDQIARTIFQKDWNGNIMVNSFSGWTERVVREWLDEHKELIIHLAAEQMVDQVKRTKMYREKMGAAIEEGLKDG